MEVARISKNEVREKLGNPDVIVIDVRHEQGSATEKIRGALLENPDKVELWQDRYAKDREIVLYCS